MARNCFSPRTKMQLNNNAPLINTPFSRALSKNRTTIEQLHPPLPCDNGKQKLTVYLYKLYTRPRESLVYIKIRIELDAIRIIQNLNVICRVMSDRS